MLGFSLTTAPRTRRPATETLRATDQYISRDCVAERINSWPRAVGLKTSAPRRRRQTQEVSDLPALTLGQLPRLRRAVPLGQGVGERVDAASPVLRNGRHVGGASPCVDPETGIVGQLGKSGCSSDTDWRATNRAARCVPVTAPFGAVP
jgi:hypothetical protein